MKDIHSGLNAVVAVAPQVLAATNTSSAIDMRGYNSALLVLAIGAIVGSGDFTAKLTECDTSGGTYTDVAAADLEGSFSATLLTSTVERIGYKGSKRYLKTVLTKNSGTSVAVSAVLMQGHPADAPVA